jgi:hypothetical protein
MKRILEFIKRLFGYGVPNIDLTQELLKQEATQIENMQKSVEEIKVIHEEISTKIKTCTIASEKKQLVLNPRLTTAQLRLYLMNNGVLEVSEMSRKEKQFYAKKIYFLRYKRGMKIVYDKAKKVYKYFKNGL